MQYAPEKNRVDLEQAIETVRKFATENESCSIPTLEPFAIKNGQLEFQDRSSLEKTLNFVQTFSPLYRAKQKEKRKAVAGTLQESVDIIKIYSSALKQVQKSDQALAKRLLQAVSSYNALVRHARKNPDSLTTKLKHFFFQMAGWKIDEALIDSEIHIPETVESDSFFGHKITIQKESRLTALLQSVHKSSEHEKTRPKKEELDAFRLKALTQLKNQYDIEELIYLLHSAPIESEQVQGSHGYATSVLSLHQVITPFPGEEIKLVGEFQRDSFHPELCFPIKESFKLYTRSSQSGFPHPMQYIGFSLHERLLPTFLLKPRALPEIQNLLEKKHTLAYEILHENHTRPHFYRRKALFNEYPHLLLRLQQVIESIAPSDAVAPFFAHALAQARPFEYISQIHEELVEKVIAEPLDVLQREWLFNSTPDIADHLYCRNILEKAIQKGIAGLTLPYQIDLAKVLAPAAANLYLMELSEHLGFMCERPSDFEKMLLTSLFRQQIVFVHEFRGAELDLEKHLTSLLEEEKLLFSQIPSQDPYTIKASHLASELIDYFI